MTTESKQDAPRGLSPLLGATAASVVLGLLVVLAAALVDGAPGARGAAAGAVITLVTFGWGTGVVSAVSRVMPSASMMIALLTYALQIVLMGVSVKIVIDASDDGARFSHGWLVVGVVTLALGWMAAQVWCTVRLRTLAYDLPSSAAGPREEAGA
ncbi:MAG: hypothetical protein ACI379_16780 [Nocardioides sp.]|uniref:hypothetical protein n=1 Tax=Nocardioides sp. TaxID=35761 RepID=UPI003F061D03